MKDLYKIKAFPFSEYILRLLLLGWIYFAYTKFDLNPNFFGVTIAIAIILFFLILETSIVVTKDSLIEKRTNWLPFLSRKRIIAKHSEIHEISYEKGNFNKLGLVLNLIEYVPGTTSTPNLFIIRKKDGSSVALETKGSQYENEKLIKIIKAKMPKE
ncbi:MAG: hypothetical protein GY810_20425 [Aureispira sp.]|nr:hypothetical protein [Aureispira sp.]